MKEEVLFLLCQGPLCSQHEGSGGRIYIWWQEAEIGRTLNVAVFFPSLYSIQTRSPQDGSAKSHLWFSSPPQLILPMQSSLYTEGCAVRKY